VEGAARAIGLQIQVLNAGSSGEIDAAFKTIARELNDGSCIRLLPLYPNHIWSYDLVEDRTHNGRKYACSASSMSSRANGWQSV
jgi:hypothetical protein